MTGLFSTQRRAEEFEAILSRSSGTPLTDREVERFAALLTLVTDLRAVPEVTPRPEFAGSLRERLMVEAETVLLPRPTASSLAPERLSMPTRGRDRRFAVLLGGAALVGATATMAVAAQTALPGESLYSVKRGIEAAEVRLAGDDATRGRALLANAESRLTEIEALTSQDQDDRSAQQAVPDTLDAFTAQSDEGVRSLLTAYAQSGSESDVERAREFTSASLERLGALEGQVPESARDELVAAGRTLTDLDLEAGIACPACAGGISTTPPFLLSSAPIDLTSGLDADDTTLEAAPISGQDVTGITVPEGLQPGSQPTTQLSPPTKSPTLTPTQPVEEPVKETTDGVKDPLKDPVKDVTDTVTDTTGGVTDTVTDTAGGVTETLDEVTGGAVGGLSGGLDDATGGLIGEVTGTLDGLTGGTVTGVTDGPLP